MSILNIALIGCGNDGKSTFLNSLFGGKHHSCCDGCAVLIKQLNNISFIKFIEDNQYITECDGYIFMYKTDNDYIYLNSIASECNKPKIFTRTMTGTVDCRNFEDCMNILNSFIYSLDINNIISIEITGHDNDDNE